MKRTKLFGSILVAAALGCGGGGTVGIDASGGNDSGPSADPLLGSWFMQVTAPTADNQTETITFSDDGSYTAVHAQTNSATSSDHAGCIESVTETGTFVDSADRTMLTITPSGSMAERAYMGCTDPTEDGAGTPVTPLLPASTMAYTLSGNTLTWGTLTLTRL
jgi:hypothetical protein